MIYRKDYITTGVDVKDIVQNAIVHVPVSDNEPHYYPVIEAITVNPVSFEEQCFTEQRRGHGTYEVRVRKYRVTVWWTYPDQHEYTKVHGWHDK